MTKRPIDIYTDAYLRSHGQQPRGTGLWGFWVQDGRDEIDLIWVPEMMTLSDAKVWARAETRRRYGKRANDLHLEVAP